VQAADNVQGTFTVNGQTRVLKHVYVGRSADPERPSRHYLIVLVSDAEVPETSRDPEALAKLAKQGLIHAVRVVWTEGVDGLTATAFHADVAQSGQPTRGGATIDLRAYDEKRLSAQIASKPLGQSWHFNARLEAAVRPMTFTAADSADAVPIVAPPVDVERDTQVERDEKTDPTAIKMQLGRLGFTATDDGFLQSVNEGNLAAVRMFLRLGLSANTAAEGQPLLLSAAVLCTREPTEGRVDIVRALLAAHAKVDVADENGSTPLLWAVNAGCATDLVRALIAAGANVNAKAKGGATPLMMAQALQRTELIAILKAAGAKP
jgi:hypothetical protein